MANGVAFAPFPPVESPAPRHPKACVPCAHLKVKCEVDADGGICKRCRRLGKVCEAQPPGSQSRKKSRARTVARLEQKLDGGAAIVAASGCERLAGTKGWESPVLPPTFSVFSPIDCMQQCVEDDGEAQLILDVFRNEMAPYFPFVVIPATVSLEDLKQNKPFLLLSVTMVGCRHNKARQSCMATAFGEILSQRVVVKGEPSLDLLQGLLVYIAWYHLHLHLGSRLSALAHLSISVLIDLGLHRPANINNTSKPLGASYFLQQRESFPARTLEERRAFLGCHYIMFIVSMSAKDLEPLRYTKYADECYRLISEAQEYPSDVHLARITQLCSLGERIEQCLKSDEGEMSTGISAPVGACVRSFEAELQGLKTALSSDPSQSGQAARSDSHAVLGEPSLLTFYYYSIEQLLYETALNDAMHESRYSTYPLSRLDMLFACLNATKACIEAFYSLPVLVYFDLPYLSWTQLGHSMVILSKLSLFVSEGWDHGFVQSVLDFPTTVDTLAVRMGAAKAAIEMSVQESAGRPGTLARGVPEIFANFAPKMQLMKEVHEMKRLTRTRPGPSHGPATNGPTSTRPGTDDDLTLFNSPNLFEFLDQSFWQPFT